MTRKIKLKISARLAKKKLRRKGLGGKKHCRFCGSAEQVSLIDYKNTPLLKSFLTDRGKILPSRISGVCCLHQRLLSNAIKNSREMALLSYTSSNW